MRHPTGVVPALLLVAAACGSPAAQTSRTSPDPPLEASLLQPTSGLGFYVSQQAYVALFDIVPGGGIGLVYPHTGRELHNPTWAGPQWISRSVPYWPATYRPPALGAVHYLFLIASRQPLNIEDYVGYSDYLRARLTNVVYTGNAYSAMNALVEEVVPSQPDEDWTTAVYIVYGASRGRRPTRIYQLVKCVDGQIYWVEIGSSFTCPPAPAAPKDTLKEGQPRPEGGARDRYKGKALVFNPANAPAASDLLRRQVTTVERAPYAPAPRSEAGYARDRDRGLSSGRSEGTLSGASPGNDTYTPATPTVTTPAQQPANSRGRVRDTSGGSSTGGAETP